MNFRYRNCKAFFLVKFKTVYLESLANNDHEFP